MRLTNLLLVVAMLVPAWAREAEPRVVIEKVIHAGEPAPGIPGYVIVLPLRPQIDQNGNVLVYAFINGPDVTPETDTAIWYGQPGRLDLIVREGGAAPGYPAGVTIRSLSGADQRLSENGWISFGARLRGPGITAGWNDRAVFAGPPGDIRPVLRGGDPAPGVPGAHINLGQDYTGLGCYLSDNATLFVVGDLAGPGIDYTNDRVFWIGTRENLRIGWREGMPVGQIEPGSEFAWADLAVFNDRQQLAFRGGLRGPSITPNNDHGRWLGPPGELQLMARSGDPVPGLAAGVTFLTAISGLSTLNSHGQSVQGGVIQGPGISADNNAILFRYDGQLTVLFREGEPAPGAGVGVVFESFGNGWVDESGRYCFLPSLRGLPGSLAQRIAFYCGPMQSPSLVFMNGLPAPGFPPGVTLTNVYGIGGSLAMSDSGYVVAPTDIAGPGVTGANALVVWIRDAVEGSWLNLLRGGSLIQGRTLAIGSVTNSALLEAYGNMTGGSDGAAQSLNDRGSLVASLPFTDGTKGIYRLSLARRGDINCDGNINFDDIESFVIALVDMAEYLQSYHECQHMNADCNGDGRVNFDDIDAFVILLIGGEI